MKKKSSSTYHNAVEKIKAMSLNDFRKMLVRLGISNKDGSLTKKYKKEKNVKKHVD